MNVERFDVTQWLIHFVRDRDPDIDTSGADEVADPVGAVLEADAEAPQVLMAILREGALRAGWSVRGGKPTIYGGRPAVCFTEMPISALATYASGRPRNRSSPYGFAMLKRELFAAGARPVIYGLSTEEVRTTYDGRFERCLSEDVLPLREQYRYVAYNPTTDGRRIDWTHEREWRWTPGEDSAHAAWATAGTDGIVDQVPALPLFRPAARGGAFSAVAIIVDRATDADSVLNQLHAMRDAGGSNLDEPFDPAILAACFVIVMEDVAREAASGRHLLAARIETLPESCMRTVGAPNVEPGAIAAVKLALGKARIASREGHQTFLAGRAPTEVRDVWGGAWVVTYRGSDPQVHALVAAGAARANGDGYYTVDAIEPGLPGAALSIAEAAASAAAASLTAELGIPFYVKSWWD